MAKGWKWRGTLEPLLPCRTLLELRVHSNTVAFEVMQSAIESFKNKEEALSSKLCIKPFDLNSSVCLRVDASEYSIRGVQLQHGHLVMFLSRMTSSEMNYSVGSGEVEEAFTIQTDHEPQKFIFQPHKGQ